MKIAAANLQMAATHVARQQHEITESLRLWAGKMRPDFEGQGRPRPAPPSAERVSISEAGKSARASEAEAAEQPSDPLDNDPRLQLVKTLLEFLTGRQIKVFDAAEFRRDMAASDAAEVCRHPDRSVASPGRSAGLGLDHDYHEIYNESQQTSFSASGTVRTADGREIAFTLSLSMQRSYRVESSVSLRLGDAVRKTDPLVLNFGGGAAQLTDTRFSFDLDSDGTAEQISFVGQGSGFLVLDRNQDGKISDGKEMFGPTSGDGFAELARLDSDGNGWIDESDPAFADLRVWSKEPNGKDRLQSLAAAGVGAVALTCVNTPFDIKDYAQATLGQIRSSGVFLQEDGKAGTIQQVDLAV